MNICRTHQNSPILLFVASINNMKLIESYITLSLILGVIIGSFSNSQLAAKFTNYRFKDTTKRSFQSLKVPHTLTAQIPYYNLLSVTVLSDLIKGQLSFIVPFHRMYG